MYGLTYVESFRFLDPETGPQWLRTLFLLSLCFTADVFLLFISPRNLRAHSADRHETLPHDRNLGEFYNAIPKFWVIRQLSLLRAEFQLPKLSL